MLNRSCRSRSSVLVPVGYVVIFVMCMLMPGSVAASAADNDGILIARDGYGIGHVMAPTMADAWYGFGYVTAQDRMFQLEVMRRSIDGTAAEVFGARFIDSDLIARRDAVSRADLERELAVAPATFSLLLRHFTEGLNDAIADAQAGRIALDPRFAKLSVALRPFSQIDVLSLFAGTMAVRYNDFSQELDNFNLLRTMNRRFGPRQAANIFDDVIFHHDPRVTSTLGGTARERRVVPHHDELLPGWADPEAPVVGPHSERQRHLKTIKALGQPPKSGSYALALSTRPRGGNEAFLLAGPQMGYFNPSCLFQIGLHWPGGDIVGATPVGYLNVMFGANRKLGFTATAGVANQVDLLLLNRPAGASDSALLDRVVVPIQRHRETIAVLASATPVQRERASTGLGPVLAEEGDRVYVKHRAWQGHVVESYAAWTEMNFAESLPQFIACGDRMALSIHWIGVDRGGHIGYCYCGMGKSRQVFGDDRLPTTHPTSWNYPDRRIAAIDPPTGILANWNAPPTVDFRNGDMQTLWGADQRTALLERLARAAPERWSARFLADVDREVAFTDLRATFFKTILLDNVNTKQLSPWQKLAYDGLRTWDDRRADDDHDGRFDNAAPTVFDAFFNQVVASFTGATLNEFVWMVSSDPTWTQSALLLNIIGGKTRYDWLHGEPAGTVITRSFKSALASVASEGAPLPCQPVPPMVFAGVNFAGVPQECEAATFTPAMNRGSVVQIISAGPRGIAVDSVMPPGNTASGDHATDQIAPFCRFAFSRMPMNAHEVLADAKHVSVLSRRSASPLSR